MYVERQRELDATGLRIGIAVSRYHGDITEALCQAAVGTFTAAGGKRDDLTIVSAPGSFELTAMAGALAAREDLDAVVALGCVIRGETAHDEYICRSVAQGLTAITLETGKPVAFGLLTCHTKHQARERAGGEHGNKGEEAMAAIIETVHTLRDIAAGKGTS